MKVAFRVDGNKRLGLGHVKRCIVLANNLKQKNTDCIFLTRFKETYNLLHQIDFKTFLITTKNEPQQIKKILKQERCSKLIIDSKNRIVEKILKNLDKKIKTVLIDNLDYSSMSDLVILSSVSDPNKQYPKNCVHGEKYILHGINKIPKQNFHKNNSILLTMGGSDKYNITKKIVKSFAKTKNPFTLLIVLGKFYDDENSIAKIISNDDRFTIIRNPLSLAELMQKSSLGISSFGVSVYEAALCSLPLIVISHNNENDYYAKLVEKLGWISYVGKYDEINYDKITFSTLKLLQNRLKLSNMRKSCSIIDRLGSNRVANLIIKL